MKRRTLIAQANLLDKIITGQRLKEGLQMEGPNISFRFGSVEYKIVKTGGYYDDCYWYILFNDQSLYLNKEELKKMVVSKIKDFVQ